MDAICCGKMKVERSSSSLRRIGRSNSTLLASELTAAASEAAYTRLSQSMRVYDEPINYGYDNNSNKRRKNRALTFLMRIFSWKNMGGDGGAIKGQTAEEAAELKKRRLSNPHRRWPVQGWGKAEVEEKATQVMVEPKKRRQRIILPNPYRRWPVQGW